LSHIVANWGYLAVAVFVLAESLGVPGPGETALIVAAAYAGHTHRLSPYLLFGVAAGSSVLGGQLGFLIGRHGGYRLAQRYGHKVRLDERRLKPGRYLFDRYGARLVFFGRFVTVLRAWAAFFAGTAQMDGPRFAAANAAGALLWAGVWTTAAYLAGDAVARGSKTATFALLGLGVVVLGGSMLLVRRREQELMLRAEAAYPD
jgi:membrane protein DedA with SNARE-associated domain